MGFFVKKCRQNLTAKHNIFRLLRPKKQAPTWHYCQNLDF